jgi:hypothetical protein
MGCCASLLSYFIISGNDLLLGKACHNLAGKRVLKCRISGSQQYREEKEGDV